MDFLGGLEVKNPPTNVGDLGDSGLIPGLGRCPGRGHGNPLQYSCLDRGVWLATFHRVSKSQTWLKQPLTHTCNRLLWAQEVGGSGLVVSDSCNPIGCSLPGSSVHGGSPGKSIGLGCLFSSPAQVVMTSCFFQSCVQEFYFNWCIFEFFFYYGKKHGIYCLNHCIWCIFNDK